MVCYHLGDFVIYEDNHELKRFHLSTSIKERIIGRIKIISRLLRLGVRASEAIDDNSFVFSIGNMLYEFNVSSGELSNGYSCGHGIRPLVFTTINGIDGFDRGIYFGGYLGNDNKEPVSIYHRIGVDNWKIVYTFPQGKINHIIALSSKLSSSRKISKASAYFFPISYPLKPHLHLTPSIQSSAPNLLYSLL